VFRGQTVQTRRPLLATASRLTKMKMLMKVLRHYLFGHLSKQSLLILGRTKRAEKEVEAARADGLVYDLHVA